MIIYSNIQSLDVNRMATSSEKFEFEFANNLSKYAHTKITIYSPGLNFGDNYDNGDIELVGIKGKNKFGDFKNIHKLFRERINPNDILLFYGYDLINMLMFFMLKYRYSTKLVNFIFDTHVGATENLRYFKKIMSKVYFNISILLLKFLDAHLLFQSSAAKELNLRKPYYVTKPGIDLSNINTIPRKINRKHLRLTYMGSLMNYNGIIELLEVFARYKDDDISLRIFGKGKLENIVKNYSNDNPRVIFGGLINQSAIQEVLLTTDLLLNLRDPQHYVGKFAYPSKLIEYMATGIPILSTDIGFDRHMKECLYTIENLNSLEIYEKIIEIKNDTITNRLKKANNAKKYIELNNNWENICNNIISFFNTI